MTKWRPVRAMGNCGGRGAFSLSLVLLIALVLAGCAGPPGAVSRPEADEPSRPAAPKRITAAIAGDPPSLYPDLNPPGAARGSETLTELVHAGLSVVDNRGALRPQLAEALPSLENGLWKLLPGGRMETTWRIREGVRWHDGAPFTADDLLFTAAVGQDREIAVFGKIGYDSLESVEATDPRTVTARWKRPYVDADGTFSRALGMPMPKHLLEKALAENKAGFIELPYWSTDFVGVGPYRVRELVRGSHLLLEAYEAYALGRPRIDTIEVKFILDPNVIGANVLAGAVDVALGRAISLEQGLALRDQWKEGRLDIAPSNAIQIHPQFLDPQPAVVGDVRFRRAVYHAIDRQQLIDAFFEGQTSIAHTWIAPGDTLYSQLEGIFLKYDFDLRRAARLLEEVGYAKGADGSYRDRGGERLAVEIRTSTPNQSQIQAMFAVGDMLQRLGVGADPVAIPPQRAQELPYRASFPAFEMLRGMSDLNSLGALHSRASRLPENGYRGVGGTNYARYMNPELDGLIERYFVTIPMPERIQVAGQVLRHITEQLVVMPLVWDVEPTLISNRLINITARHKDSSNAWNAHEWELRS
jgi:peptide/nickel transport system substrate-binding protein